jgi:hypothetical protein
LTLKSYGQCGREYPSGFYHKSEFVNPSGDTLNKLDNSGLYHGQHLYTKSEDNLYNDTTSYLLGKFHHGQPIGEWIDHCKDNSYSVGQFSMGSGEVSSDGKGGWTEKKHGLYSKVGVWKYYDNKGVLQQTMRYDRNFNHKGWTDQTFKMDSAGKFVLIDYEFLSRHDLKSRFKKQVNKSYSNQGVPIFADIRNFWHNISNEYDENGQLIKTTKQKKLFGKIRKVTLVKEYNSKGQLKCKTKTKCKHPDTHKIICTW